nr:uncharacterized protein CFP56_11388 [Quercus suber]
MASAFVPKSRRVRFELTLSILDLNNVPLVSGTSFVKWHLPSSTAAEHRGRTPKCAIKDHRVNFDYSINIPVRLTVGKDGMLQENCVDFEVLQEYSAGGRGERITLGHVKCNLAEYVEASEMPVSPGATRHGMGDGGGDGSGIVRRYLMRDSKINSTLKLSIYMKFVEGTRDYIAPPLRTAPVFGGIAGIIQSSEPASTTHGVGSRAMNGGETDHEYEIDSAPIPSLSTTNREMGEMQDMYRRTLAAFWASQPGELKADECIEDIFAGGDGWGKHGRPQSSAQDTTPRLGSGRGIHMEGGDGERRHGHGQGHGHNHSNGHISRDSGGSSRGLLGLSLGTHRDHRDRKLGKRKGLPRREAGEVDEFDIRDDLRMWNVGKASDIGLPSKEQEEKVRPATNSPAITTLSTQVGYHRLRTGTCEGPVRATERPTLRKVNLIHLLLARYVLQGGQEASRQSHTEQPKKSRITLTEVDRCSARQRPQAHGWQN